MFYNQEGSYTGGSSVRKPSASAGGGAIKGEGDNAISTGVGIMAGLYGGGWNWVVASSLPLVTVGCSVTVWISFDCRVQHVHIQNCWQFVFADVHNWTHLVWALSRHWGNVGQFLNQLISPFLCLSFIITIAIIDSTTTAPTVPPTIAPTFGPGSGGSTSIATILNNYNTNLHYKLTNTRVDSIYITRFIRRIFV